MSNKTEVVLNFQSSKGVVSPMIYGHFSEHIGGVFYDGLWVGEDSPVENIRGFRKSLVESFKKIAPPVLRWPGGCFAETYDWRDGIGPRDKRPTRVNWWYCCDHRLESNAVGTHEFMDFCRMVGAQPYVAANITSLKPMDIRSWVEYCNFPAGTTTLANERAANGDTEPFNVKYWGIGNENWGGGGQMTPEECMQEFKRYTAVCNSLDRGNLRFIMCGAAGHDIDWTRRLLKEWSAHQWHEAPVWGMSVYYYCSTAGWPQEFTEDEWYQQLFQADYMRRIVDDHRAAMDEFDPDRKIGIVVDEWGAWHRDGSGPSKGKNLFEQQSSMRDAMVSALTLNIFNNRCDVVSMANVAQLCNNLHCLYLAGGNNFVETPTYHVFDMYQGHKGGKHIATTSNCPVFEREGFAPMESLSVSASEKDGKVTVTLANLSLTQAQEVTLSCVGGALGSNARIATLWNEDAHACNTFEQPENVQPVYSEMAFTKDSTITVPAAGIVALTIE